LLDLNRLNTQNSLCFYCCCCCYFLFYICCCSFFLCFFFSGPTCIPTSSDGLNKSWIENTNVCFLNRGLPLRVKNCSDYNGTNPSCTQNANAFDSVSPAWTSFIRSYVINSTTQTSDICRFVLS
jgi:hypothetical protein